MMGQRRIFLLFLSAMALSIIVMVIIYGVFFRDLEVNFNVKTPETAPSPIDVFNQPEEEKAQPEVAEEGSAQDSAKVQTPERTAEAQQDTEAGNEDESVPKTEESITDVIPLEPQVKPPGEGRETSPRAKEPSTKPTTPDIVNTAEAAVPTLHYVYLDGFSSRQSAEQAIQQLQNRDLAAQPYVRRHHGQIILQFGVFSDRENADIMAQQLRNQNVFVKVE